MWFANVEPIVAKSFGTGTCVTNRTGLGRFAAGASPGNRITHAQANAPRRDARATEIKRFERFTDFLQKRVCESGTGAAMLAERGIVVGDGGHRRYG